MAAEEKNSKYCDCCVYKITVGDDFYIGATNNFANRKRAHKGNIKSGKPQLVYNTIRSHGSWQMERLFNINVTNHREQLEEERKAVEELKPTLNMYKPIITHEEHLKHCREKMRIYRAENSEKVAAAQKAYREGPHREENLAKKRAYNKANPEKPRPLIIITCECGKEINKRRLAAHRKTKAHIKIMEGI